MVDTCATYFNKRSLYLDVADADIVPSPSVHSGCQIVPVTESQYTWFIVFVRTFGIVRLIPQIQSSTGHQKGLESKVPQVKRFVYGSCTTQVLRSLNLGQVNMIKFWIEQCQLKKSVVSTDRIIGNSVRHHNNPCDYRFRYLNNLTLHYH